MITLNNFFDKIYLINLDRRQDRLETCHNIMVKYNITYERFSAVDGSKLEIELGENTTFDKKNDLGCTLSHLNLLKEIKLNNYEKVLILEDDFELSDDFFNLFNERVKQLPENWEWLYFGGSHVESPTKITENIYRVNKINTTHAYALKIDIVDKLIDYLSDEFSTSVDVRYSKYQKNLNTYVFIPHLIYQREGFSDIQEKIVDYKIMRNYKPNE